MEIELALLRAWWTDAGILADGHRPCTLQAGIELAFSKPDGRRRGALRMEIELALLRARWTDAGIRADGNWSVSLRA